MKIKWTFCTIAATLAAGTALTLASNFGVRVLAQPETNPTQGCFDPAKNMAITDQGLGGSSLQLSCAQPDDVTDLHNPDVQVVQHQANLFAWQEFMALNWPAKIGQRGVPDLEQPISSKNNRVWETWKRESEVFLDDGAAPLAWNEQGPLSVKVSDPEIETVLLKNQKTDDFLDAKLQAAGSDARFKPVLTDQQGKLVRYDIRMNKVMFDYIVQNRLYNGLVQAQAKQISFPVGSMLAKAAWREITPGQADSFYTTTALVCGDAAGKTTACRKQLMGLVGLHITQKTPNAPQWIWATFEHVNNLPDPASSSGEHSFNNPNCRNCTENHETNPGTPNQLTRERPIPSASKGSGAEEDNTLQLNADVAKALEADGSVLSQYQLIGVQWPMPKLGSTKTGPQNAGDTPTVFKVKPDVLANSTMESYVQTTSSCMGCHAMARTSNQDGFVFSDFSFVLNNAKPATVNHKLLAAPGSPKDTWEKQNWPRITRGYNLAARTYELLPKHVPTARLHCSSCHLNQGRNSDSAWWVGLERDYPTVPDLQKRINSCFTNSLNGVALCKPGSDCEKSEPMRSLVSYTQWLDRQWNAIKGDRPTAKGLSKIPTLVGDAGRGSQVFAQKCAVCHNIAGQGRYLGGVYFRPALWGEQSFNFAAGMFTNPSFLASFIKNNMPYGSGGVLTDQEAWDAATFIHGMPRPTKRAK
jgi:cytochrome c